MTEPTKEERDRAKFLAEQMQGAWVVAAFEAEHVARCYLWAEAMLSGLPDDHGNEYAIVTHWKDKMEAQEARLIALEAVAAALRVTRGQWIHSVNAEECLSALAVLDALGHEKQ